MTATLHRFFSRPMLIIVGNMLIAILVASTLALVVLPRLSSHAFAASHLVSCAQSPTMEVCNNQDPELQGCAADAQTTAQQAIVYAGVTIGSVERRYSPICHSWWGRVFDDRIAAQGHLDITIGATMLSALPTFSSSQYRILYSSMIFDATPTQQPPLVVGAVEVDGAVPFPSALIPVGN
jgi:hypothetical protein